MHHPTNSGSLTLQARFVAYAVGLSAVTVNDNIALAGQSVDTSTDM